MILKLILITSVLVLGWTIASQPGMLLGHVREWAMEQKSKWFEPLFICHWCMPSIWSSLGFLFAFSIGELHHFSLRLLAAYPLVVCGSSITSGILWEFYLTMNARKEYYISKTDNDDEVYDEHFNSERN